MTTDQAADDIVGLLLTPWNVLLMVAVWTVIQAVRAVAPQHFMKGTKGAKMLPAVPILMCQVAVWIPGPWLTGDETAAQRVVLGTVIGACTSNLHAVLSKIGLHQLLRMDVKH